MLERVLDLDPVGVLVVDIVDLENVGLVDVYVHDPLPLPHKYPTSLLQQQYPFAALQYTINS